MQLNVYGVGNSLVDLQSAVNDDALQSLGFSKGLMTLVDSATQSRVLDRLDATTVSRCAGGSAANTVMGVADFGGRTAYAGKVGRDPLGEFFLHDMRAAGVAIDVRAADAPTGTCVILITGDAQRTMLTSLGASATLAPDDIDAAHVQAAQYVYIEGYLFASERRSPHCGPSTWQEHGVKVAFTVSDPFHLAALR
jgi:sugar/nucleoside kinase (ribokinase family)